MLARGTKHTGSAVTPADLTKGQRRIHPTALACLQAIWADDPTGQPRSILHILADMPAYNDRAARAIRDEVMTHWERMHARNPIIKGANIRSGQDEPMLVPVKRSTGTGYAQYLAAKAAVANVKEPAKNAKCIKKMHDG